MLLFRKQILNTKGYSGSNNVRSGVKNIFINNFPLCHLSNISNVECLAVTPKSVRMVTILLFVFFVLLSAAMIPDKSAVVALRGGGVVVIQALMVFQDLVVFLVQAVSLL